MIYKKLGFYVLIFSQPRTYYYKLMTIDGSQACVEAYTTNTIGKRFGASKGTCKEIDCNTYRGSKYVLFVGEVFGYLC